MRILTVIRHSLTTANEQGLLMGSRLNSPLSEKGKELARVKALSLKKQGFIPEKVYTSMLLRTKQTAEIILEELGLDIEIIELKDLNERDFGKYDGRLVQELLDSFDNFGPNPPTVETVDHFIKRVTSCLERIKSETKKSTLMVTHTNNINVMKSALFDPENLRTFWQTSNPEYCEGIVYKF
jgi:broad specificity phosphatase PhoE